jgi:uncharacterized protein YciI
MPLFVLHCIDKPGALDVRIDTRKAHLDYIAGLPGVMKLGGPLLSEDGAMAGSLMIIEAEDLQAAKAFNAVDPYTQAGLWGSVDIRPFRATIGEL